MTEEIVWIRRFPELSLADVPEVGGKNASLGELIRHLSGLGVRVPDGFATTAAAYRAYLAHNELEERIGATITSWRNGELSLHEAGQRIRRWLRRGRLPEPFAAALEAAYAELSAQYDTEAVDVAVRSSATAEDLPSASFAGQQESYLNVVGVEELLETVRLCFASLFTDRAISYREQQGFDHLDVALSVGVQKMVRSDLASAGVIFTIDTESGFPDVVIVTGAWGLGENVVKGVVTPDEWIVFKPLLERDGKVPILARTLGDKQRKLVYATGTNRRTKSVRTSTVERKSFVLEDTEVLELARWAVAIERHYQRPMDIEWAKDGRDGRLYVVQARPETVQARKRRRVIERVELLEHPDSLLEGLAVGEGIAQGPVRVVHHLHELESFPEGAVLVTGMTDPDWVPLMRLASAIVTDHGGRTCHAAIVSRELGIPAVVGTGTATRVLRDGQVVTVSCAEGSTGRIYAGEVPFRRVEIDLERLPQTRTKLMLNIATPAAAFAWWKLPAAGIGLARMEFIIANEIKAHPLALLHPERLDDSTQRRIERLVEGYPDGASYFVDKLAQGIARIAAVAWPNPVVVRTSDFKTNEYAALIGGAVFEPVEHNPMLGFRGASRYYSPRYREGFLLECRALARVRNEIGLDNVVVMIPFCRTPEEADKVLAVMAEGGLERGRDGLQVYVMCEIPANVILTEEFAERFDGFSIGSNDLTQLVLGVDRDSELLAELFDERNEAVRRFVAEVIRRAHAAGRYVGICGQAPSDYPEFAEFLVREGIDAISLNPDSFVEVCRRVAALEAELGRGG